MRGKRKKEIKNKKRNKEKSRTKKQAGTDGFDDDGIHELERGLDHEFVSLAQHNIRRVKDFNDAVAETRI